MFTEPSNTSPNVYTCVVIGGCYIHSYIHTLAHALSVPDKVDMDVEFIIILFYPCVFRDRVVVITAQVVTSVGFVHVSLS